MSQNFAFNYAELDPATGMCIGFQSTSAPLTEEELAASGWVVVEVNDPNYLGKYYLNGSWYEDAAGTIPWTSSML